MKRSVLTVVFVAATVASSYGQPFRYAVKFVCGNPAVKTASPVAPGTYFTAINVHNTISKDIKLQKQFSIALPGEKAGRVSKTFEVGLGAAQSMEIDCADILKHLDASGFVKGFALIESEVPLDIVAVYTTAATGSVNSFFLERVPARR